MGSLVPMVPMPGLGASVLESYLRFLVFVRARDKEIELERERERDTGLQKSVPLFMI